MTTDAATTPADTPAAATIAELRAIAAPIPPDLFGEAWHDAARPLYRVLHRLRFDDLRDVARGLEVRPARDQFWTRQRILDALVPRGGAR